MRITLFTESERFWNFSSYYLDESPLNFDLERSHTKFEFYWTDIAISAWLPYWFLVMLAAIIAAIPWIKWRFSLRTFLIVVTLLALFFGMIALSL